jgi:hypothetical protein
VLDYFVEHNFDASCASVVFFLASRKTLYLAGWQGLSALYSFTRAGSNPGKRFLSCCDLGMHIETPPTFELKREPHLGL